MRASSPSAPSRPAGPAALLAARSVVVGGVGWGEGRLLLPEMGRGRGSENNSPGVPNAWSEPPPAGLRVALERGWLGGRARGRDASLPLWPRGRRCEAAPLGPPGAQDRGAGPGRPRVAAWGGLPKTTESGRAARPGRAEPSRGDPACPPTSEAAPARPQPVPVGLGSYKLLPTPAALASPAPAGGAPC